MSSQVEDTRRLGQRDRELAAIGAAIACNCVPCIEYHIPQGRNAGLSDSQIREAVELSDRVRRVPADKVLQTAFALLDAPDRTQTEADRDACGCSGGGERSGAGAGDEASESYVKHGRLDSESSKEHNQAHAERGGDNASPSTTACASDEAAAGSRDAPDRAGFDFSPMMKMLEKMQMMQQCCPEKMKDFSSMMSGLDSGCCSPGEDSSSEGSARK